MTKLFFRPDLSASLKEKILILDTNILIEASKAPNLKELLIKIKDAGCFMISTTMVRSELLRGAQNMRERQELDKIISVIGISLVQGIDKTMFQDIGAKFQLLIHKLAPKASIADEELLFLATLVMGKPQREAKLLTINHKDVPQELYECQDIIIIQDHAGIRPAGIYSLKRKEFSERMLAVK